MSNSAFAILSNGPELPLEIEYLNYEHQSGQGEKVADADVVHLNFNYSSNPSNEHTHTIQLDRSPKPGSRLYRLINFLVPEPRCTASSDILTLGSCTLVERRETTYGARGYNFWETKFQFQGCNGEKSLPLAAIDVQFLGIESSMLKATDSIANFGSVDITSGMCLFSRERILCLRSWILSNSDAADITKALRDSKPGLMDTLPAQFGATLYEIDSLTRLSNTIANIVLLLPTTLRIQVVLDIPRVQYYYDFLDLLLQKHCSIDQFKLWTAIIDHRHDQLFRIFRTTVEEEIRRRGCDQSRVTLQESPGLEIVVPEILDASLSYNDVSIESLMAKLQVQDPLWREFFKLVDEHPKTLPDLYYLSYVHQAIRPVLERTRSKCKPEAGRSSCQKDSKFVRANFSDPSHTGKHTRQLLLHIENPLERCTFFKADKLLKLHRKKYPGMADPLTLGFFPCERVFTKTSSGRSGLFFQVAEQVSAQARGNAVQSMDTVAMAYGQDSTNIVRLLLAEEGMLDGFE